MNNTPETNGRSARRAGATPAVLWLGALVLLAGGAPAAATETARSMTIWLNKSVPVELPEDIREVVISEPAIVEAVPRTSRRVHLTGQKIGQATAIFIGRDGHRVLSLDISVERDLAPVAALIQRLVPSAKIQLESINDNIVLMGTATSPLDASRIADIAGRFVASRDQVLNMVNVEANEQVLLRVKVAEMNRSVIQRMGVDIGEVVASGNVAIVKMAEAGFPLTGASALATSFDAVSGAFRGPGVGTIAAASWGNGKARVDAILQALERNGLARTLAEPTLTSMSGETAKFLAGGEYPVPVGSDRDGITISFKSFGVGLSFTPVVLSEGRISMEISTEVSELTNNGAVTVNDLSIPALSVRRASSTLELPSGGSLVMAGLISSQTRRNVDGLPGLRDLPVLGALFRSEEFTRSETELVVIVTPYLVEAAGAGELALPGETGKAAPVLAAKSAQSEADSALGYIIE
jgi:pilus assembly protein CpaC